MSKPWALVWVPFGFVVSIIDAWLSVQSLFGIMNPNNALGYTGAAVVGISLTGFAIYAPIVLEARRSSAFLIAWMTLCVLDIGTSIVGAMWYGLMAQPLNAPIQFSYIEFAPGNWVQTLGYIAFVLIVAGVCVQFGRALKLLMKKD